MSAVHRACPAHQATQQAAAVDRLPWITIEPICKDLAQQTTGMKAILLPGPLGQYMAAAFCDHALEAAGGQLWTIHRGKDRLISSPQDIPNESTYTG